MTSEHDGATIDVAALDDVADVEGVVVAAVDGLEDDQLHDAMLALDDAGSLPIEDRLELLQRTEGLLAASLEALDGL